MIENQPRPDAPPPPARSGSWRQVRSVMAISIFVAVVSLALRGCASRTSDATLLFVWAPIATVLGLLGFWSFRGMVAAIGRPARVRSSGCIRCGSDALVTLLRERPGRDPEPVGHRCRHCRTTYRWLDGELVGFVPARRREPFSNAGIRFEDDPGGDEIQFLDEPGADPPPDR